MKTINVTVGEKAVAVELKRVSNDVVEFKATIGTTVETGRMTLYPKFDQTDAQFEKDVADFSEKIAKDCAGRARSKELIDKLLGSEILPEEKTDGKDQKD
jgi:hypothetical protein